MLYAVVPQSMYIFGESTSEQLFDSFLHSLIAYTEDKSIPEWYHGRKKVWAAEGRTKGQINKDFGEVVEYPLQKWNTTLRWVHLSPPSLPLLQLLLCSVPFVLPQFCLKQGFPRHTNSWIFLLRQPRFKYCLSGSQFGCIYLFVF